MIFRITPLVLALLAAASTFAMPCFRFWLANSTIKMPFFVTKPTNMMSPIMA